MTPSGDSPTSSMPRARPFGFRCGGQVLSEDGPWVDDTVSFTYTNQLRTSLTILAPNASPWLQAYAYDAGRRLTNVTSPAGSFAYHYPPNMQRMVSTVFLPNGASITNGYDGVARLTGTSILSQPGRPVELAFLCL